MTGRTGPEGRGTLGEAAAGQSIGIVSGAAAAQAPALAGASRVVDTTAPVRVGDKRAHWRRRAAYAVMITYAILMFIPFAWSLITSFKTLPDSVQLTFIPQPFTLDAWRYVFQNLNPSIFRLFATSAGIALAVTLSNLFLSSPRDIEEAARIDGAGFFTTFWRVMLPLATPALSAVAILQFQGAWNSFFWPLIFLRDQSYFTVPIGLTFFKTAGGFSTNYPPLMAVVVLSTLPVLILYIFFQRYFVEGIAASGVKG